MTFPRPGVRGLATFLGLTVAVALLTACSGSPYSAPATATPTTTATATPTPLPAATPTPTATAAPAPGPTPTATPVPPTPTPAPASSSTVQVRQDQRLGSILVDSPGRTLYRFSADRSGVSNCYDQCAQNWPPFILASGEPLPPAGLPGGLAVAARRDGARHVTYNGSPLYHFIGDTRTGDTQGQGINAFGGQWSVVTPTAASQPAPTPTATPAATPTPAPRPTATATPTPAPTPTPTPRPTPTPTPAPTPTPEALTAHITDFAHQNIRIPPGAIVTWSNHGGVAHTTTATDGAWRSSTLASGQSFTFTFRQTGTFTYICEIHPTQMKATVTVTTEATKGEATTAEGTSEGYGY